MGTKPKTGDAKIKGTAENWENGTLGESLEFAKKSDLSVDDVCKAIGLHPISIRLPVQMIDDLKRLAKSNGIGEYQTLMKQILARFIECELKNKARQAIDEELDSFHDDNTKPQKAAC